MINLSKTQSTEKAYALLALYGIVAKATVFRKDGFEYVTSDGKHGYINYAEEGA